MRRARGLLLSSMVVIAACGEAPPPPVTVPAPKPVAAPEPDLSPVAEPKSLVLLARAKAPTREVQRALDLFGVPLSLDAILEKEDPEAFRALRLDATFDVALALDPQSSDDDPKFFAVVSVPLASFEEARAAAQRRSGDLDEIAPGVLRLPAKPSAKGHCDVARAVGDAPARLVCGDQPRALDALRDFMSRGVPRLSPPRQALEVSVRFRAAQDRWLPRLHAEVVKLEQEARERSADLGVKDPVLVEAPGVAGLEAERFLADLDRLDFGLRLDEKPPELVGDATLRFGARSSWLTQVLTDAAARPRAAPSMFWRVPKDANAASWSESADPARFEGVRAVLQHAASAVFEKIPIKADDKGSVLGFLAHAPRIAGPTVYASGPLKFDAPPEKPGPHPTAAVFAEAKAYAKTAVGWTMFGVHGSPDPYVAWAKEGVDVYERGVRAAKGLVKNPADKEALDFIPALTLVRAPPGWPKGTVALDLKVTFDRTLAELLLPHERDHAIDVPPVKAKPAKRAAAPAPKPPSPKDAITFRLVIVPDQGDTWIAFSGDQAELLKRVKAALAGAPPEGTIASRAGLDPLRAGERTSAGFSSFGDLLETLVKTAEREKPDKAPLLEEVLASMPNRGRTPILFLGSGSAGPAPAMTAEVRIEQGSLADLAGLFRFLFVSEHGKQLWSRDL